MNCPKCHGPGAEEIADEVDIGVGIMRHVTGWDCMECGQIAACYSCGVPDFLPHRKGCEESACVKVTPLVK
jgi:hypothetical protein